MKMKVLEKIIKEYNLIDGQIISGNFLKQIAYEQNMLPNEIITLLGISENNKNRILKKDSITMKINIKDELERDKIESQIQQLFLGRYNINREEIEKLEKQIKISAILICKYLGMNSKKSYEIRNRYKHVYLKPLEYMDSSVNKEIINLLKIKNTITKLEVEKIKEMYNKTDKEMIVILKVKEENYKSLMNRKTTYLKIDLITKEEKQELIKKMKEYKKDGVITVEDLKHLKEIINATDKIIKEVYGIKEGTLKDLLNYKIKTTRIKDIKEQKKVKLLKIDLKYNEKYGERYYTKKELKKIAKSQKIEFEAMLLYLYHPNYYLFNKLALEKNSKGIWIGQNKEITYQFWKENIDRLKKISDQAATNICYMYGIKENQKELEEIAYDSITNSGFLIEKNFGFDKRLQNNLFRKKGKYAILNFYKYQNRVTSYTQYEERFGVTEDKNRIFIDNTSNPEELIEQQSEFNISNIPIYKHHQRIIYFMKKFEEIILTNREYGIKIIAKNMKIPINKLNKYIKEIQEILINNKMVKETYKNEIIQMNEEN